MTNDTSTSESENNDNVHNWNNSIITSVENSNDSSISKIFSEGDNYIPNSDDSGNHVPEVDEVGFTNYDDFENPNNCLDQNENPWDFLPVINPTEISENSSYISSQIRLTIDSSTDSDESMIPPYVLYQQPDIDYDNFRYKFSDSDSTNSISEGEKQSSSEGDLSSSEGDISKIFSSEGGIEN